MDNSPDTAISFAGAKLDKYRHVCAFFDTPDEEYRVLLPFIREGFDLGEKAFHIVDPKLREAHIRRGRCGNRCGHRSKARPARS